MHFSWYMIVVMLQQGKNLTIKNCLQNYITNIRFIYMLLVIKHLSYLCFQNLIRERRSPDQVYDNGHVRGEVNRDNNGNTNVAVGAQGNIYKDKARSVDAEAQWSKVISGPGRAKPQVSGRITYRW